MAYSPSLTSFFRYRDPKLLWPLAGGISVIGHLLILAMLRTIVVETSPATETQSAPLPIQLISEPLPTDAVAVSEPSPVESATASSAPLSTPVKPVEESATASPTPSANLESPRSAEDSPVAARPTLAPLPRATAPIRPGESPRRSAIPRPTIAAQALPNPAAVQPPPTAQPSPATTTRPGTVPVAPPPVRPSLSPEPSPTVSPVVTAPPQQRPSPEVTPAPESTNPVSSPPNRGEVEAPPVTRPPVANPPVSPPAEPTVPEPQPGPTTNPEPVAPPPTNPNPTAPAVEPPATAGNPGADSQSGQLRPLRISPVPGGRDFADTPPRLQQADNTIALLPLASTCGIRNLDALLAAFQPGTIRIRIQVEASGIISNTWIVDNQGSGNSALDNLVMCSVKHQLRLEPATVDGEPWVTNSYVLEAQLQ